MVWKKSTHAKNVERFFRVVLPPATREKSLPLLVGELQKINQAVSKFRDRQGKLVDVVIGYLVGCLFGCGMRLCETTSKQPLIFLCFEVH